MKPEVTLYIKNMVCNRCIRVVWEELERLGLTVQHVVLGEATVLGDKARLPIDKIRTVLEQNGFELIENTKGKIIERIKHVVLRLVQHDHERNPLNMKLSSYIAREIDLDYRYLSTLFSSVENVTIEQYFILQKIERVKELIKYNEFTLSEIAYKLGYSSVQHLSNQFRKVTGMSPSQFKALRRNRRKPIDRVT